MKNKTILYKIAVGLLVLLFGFGGVSNLLRFPETLASLETLRYPQYFSSILGVAQLSGIIVLLIPEQAKLKEFAFIGFFINLIAALTSHLVVEGLVPVIGIILFALVVLTTAFMLFLKLRKAESITN